MKQLLLVLIVAFQTIFLSAAQAWSPMNEVRSAVESMQYCYLTVASSEDEQGGEENKTGEEDEEEPDCD